MVTNDWCITQLGLKIMEHETFDVLTKFQSFELFVGQGGASHKRIKANVTCSDPEFLCWGGGGGWSRADC